MNTDLIIWFIGVVISIFLYLLADRKTIGAKKEKTKSIYEEIIKTIFRSIVHENNILNTGDIERIISTKCLENNLKRNNLPTSNEILNSVYTRIIQDEVLDGKKKLSLTLRINDLFEKNSKMIIEEITDEESSEDNMEKVITGSFILGFSLIATLIAFLFSLNIVFSINRVYLLLVTFIVTLLAITIISIGKRFNDNVDSLRNTNDTLNNYKKFESRIKKIIKPFWHMTKPIIKTDNGFIEFDFEFKHEDKNYFVEIKSLISPYSKYSIIKLLEQGKLIKLNNKSNISILIVDNKKAILHYIDKLENNWDYIFDEKEFKEFINNIHR